MDEGQGDQLRRYHELTKHSVERLQADRHTLDWDNQPIPYKIYPDLEPLPLPRDWPASPVPALGAIAAPAIAPTGTVVPSLAELARLLLFSAGITRKHVYASGQEVYFRAAACTGALYHIDVYLVCGPLADLAAGVYHFGIHDFALRRLRAGDHRATVVAASGGEPAVAAAPVILVYASTFWRNAWKYRARAYRHCFWDAGTILANALAIAAADRLPARVVLGFVDATFHDLLGLDPAREAALALLAVGHGPDARPSSPPPTTPLALATLPLSAREIAYPEMRAAHDASSLATPADVAAWRGRVPAPAPAAARDAVVPLPPAASVPNASIDDVIRRRGSTRAFARTPIGSSELAVLLERATGPIPMDILDGDPTPLRELYLIINAVDGIASGAYAYHRDAHALELIRAGDLRREAGFLDLGQDLAADASVDAYLLADLGPILAAFGDRGYRAAQLAAAITGGRLYLAAYALRLGATGLTFFDDAVTAFFGPQAEGKSVMFLTAIGRPRRRTREAAS
jgi:SagB-type dehydrogenase family enzyme